MIDQKNWIDQRKIGKEIHKTSKEKAEQKRRSLERRSEKMRESQELPNNKTSQLVILAAIIDG